MCSSGDCSALVFAYCYTQGKAWRREFPARCTPGLCCSRFACRWRRTMSAALSCRLAITQFSLRSWRSVSFFRSRWRLKFQVQVWPGFWLRTVTVFWGLFCLPVMCTWTWSRWEVARFVAKTGFVFAVNGDEFREWSWVRGYWAGVYLFSYQLSEERGETHWGWFRWLTGC